MPHSGRHFLRFWCDLVPKRSILWAPWRPAGPKMAPKIAQMVLKMVPELLRRNYTAPTCFQDRFRSTPGHHFFGFLVDFDPRFKDFLIFFLQDFRYQFGPSFCTPPKTGLPFYCKILTKNAKTSSLNGFIYVFNKVSKNAKNRQELTKAKRQRTQTSNLHITARYPRN